MFDMQLTCQKVGELLSSYLDNEIDTTTSLAIARHIENCQACRTESLHLVEISSGLRNGFREFEASPADYIARAESVNQNVRRAILASVAAAELSPTQMLPMASGSQSARTWMVRHWRFPRTFAAAAAVVIVSLAAGLMFTLLPGRENALLANVISMHGACIGWEHEELGCFRGERGVQRMSEQYNIPFPDLKSVNMQVESAHTCRIRSATFIHFYFLRNGARISVFYGQKEGVAQMRSCEGQVTPEKIYNLNKHEVSAVAFATAQGDALWAVAGQISEPEAAGIANFLRTRLVRSSSPASAEEEKVNMSARRDFSENAGGANGRRR